MNLSTIYLICASVSYTTCWSIYTVTFTSVVVLMSVKDVQRCEILGAYFDIGALRRPTFIYALSKNHKLLFMIVCI